MGISASERVESYIQQAKSIIADTLDVHTPSSTDERIKAVVFIARMIQVEEHKLEGV